MGKNKSIWPLYVIEVIIGFPLGCFKGMWESIYFLT